MEAGSRPAATHRSSKRRLRSAGDGVEGFLGGNVITAPRAPPITMPGCDAQHFGAVRGDGHRRARLLHWQRHRLSLLTAVELPAKGGHLLTQKQVGQLDKLTESGDPFTGRP